MNYIVEITYRDYTDAEQEKDKVYEVTRDPRKKDKKGN